MSNGIGDRDPDPRVAVGRPNPAGPVGNGGLTVVGFLGGSEREGYMRIYLDRELTIYVEFDVNEVADHTVIPADRSPFVGEQATAVWLNPGVTVAFTRTRSTDDLALPAAILRSRFLEDVIPMDDPSGDVCLRTSRVCP